MSRPKRQHKRKAQPPGSKKQGRAYEEAVCDLVRLCYRGARATAGVWVEGPDGRRELDVDIYETINGQTVHGIVECKDFNPATTGPVGIGYIDALDSKRRDLNLNFAMLCSNAGFTADAIRKASRVGIGLISAARAGDKRVRFGVVEEIYVRHIRIVGLQLRFWPVSGEVAPPLETVPSEAFTFEGLPVSHWFHARMHQLIGCNPIVQGEFHDSCRLKAPIRLDYPGGHFRVERIALEVKIEGAWFAQSVTLDASAGLYNRIRRRMLLASGDQQLHMRDFDPFSGEWIACPPALEKTIQKRLPGEVDMKLIVFKSVVAMGPAPSLDVHVVDEDLSLEIRGMLPSSVESVPGFSSAKV